MAVIGAAVYLYRQSGLHFAEYLGLCHERAGGSGRQRIGVARLHSVRCGCRGGVVGRCVARRHGDADGHGHQPLRGAGGDHCHGDPAPATGKGRTGAGLKFGLASGTLLVEREAMGRLDPGL